MKFEQEFNKKAAELRKEQGEKIETAEELLGRMKEIAEEIDKLYDKGEKLRVQIEAADVDVEMTLREEIDQVYDKIEELDKEFEELSQKMPNLDESNAKIDALRQNIQARHPSEN